VSVRGWQRNLCGREDWGRRECDEAWSLGGGSVYVKSRVEWKGVAFDW